MKAFLLAAAKTLSGMTLSGAAAAGFGHLLRKSAPKTPEGPFVESIADNRDGTVTVTVLPEAGKAHRVTVSKDPSVYANPKTP